MITADYLGGEKSCILEYAEKINCLKKKWIDF